MPKEKKVKRFSDRKCIASYEYSILEIYNTITGLLARYKNNRNIDGYLVEYKNKPHLVRILENYKNNPNITHFLQDYKNDPKIYPFLVDYKNNPNKVDSLGSLIHLSVLVKNSKAVEWFLENGSASSINFVDSKGNTPLHYASANGDDVCTYLLLKYGASRIAFNYDQKPPGSFAAKEGHFNLAAQLHPAFGISFFKRIESRDTNNSVEDVLNITPSKS